MDRMHLIERGLRAAKEMLVASAALCDAAFAQIEQQCGGDEDRMIAETGRRFLEDAAEEIGTGE